MGGCPGTLGRGCAWSLHRKLSLYTGSLVPTQDLWSLHGMLGLCTGSLVPTRGPWSLHGMLGSCMGSAWSVL